MILKLLLLFVLYSHISQSKNITPCVSNSPCLRACPCPATTKSKQKLSSQPSLCVGTVYCIAERCICPQSQILQENCRAPKKSELNECSFPQFNFPVIPSGPSIPSIPVGASSTGVSQVLQICTVETSKCQKPRIRNFCVFSYISSPQGGGTTTIIPGLPIPIQIPGFQVPQLPIPQNPITSGDSKVNDDPSEIYDNSMEKGKVVITTSTDEFSKGTTVESPTTSRSIRVEM